MVFAALKGFDKICMYLSLRTDDVNQEDSYTGLNILSMYILKEDYIRCQQLLMRGANVNYATKAHGKTALHHVIERGMSLDVVRWLLKAGADPHIEDSDGFDSCDRA